MDRDKLTLTIVAILAIVFLEAIALIVGINGAAFGIAIAIIAGLAGYKIKPPSRK